MTEKYEYMQYCEYMQDFCPGLLVYNFPVVVY